MLLNKRLSGKELFLILFFIALSFFYAYFFVIYPYKAQRLYFKINQIYVKNHINCSSDAPQWMREFVDLNIEKNKTLGNQLVYISPIRGAFLCTSPSGIGNKISKNTFFRYASNTKPITNAYILMLINEGKIKKSTTLAEVFPELKSGKLTDTRILNITIGNLLQHSSGFDRMISKDIMFEEDKKPWCPYDISKLKELKLDFTPGEYSAYDNRNSCLLGAVIEKIEKKKYREVINKNFDLDQLNIEFIDGPYLSNEAKYDFTYNEFRFDTYYKHLDFNALSSSAGMVGSAESLAKLLQKILNNEKYLGFINLSRKDYSCEKDGIECFNDTMKFKVEGDKAVQYKYGNLPSATSFSLIDKHGAIVVWMGAGERLDYTFKFEDYFINQKQL